MNKSYRYIAQTLVNKFYFSQSDGTFVKDIERATLFKSYMYCFNAVNKFLLDGKVEVWFRIRKIHITTEIDKSSTPTLTVQKKLMAFEHKYYNHSDWEPKVGDYYTLTRSHLGMELFQIVDENENNEFGIKQVYGEYMSVDANVNNEPTYFDKETFLMGFGACRVHVPLHILNLNI